MTPTQKQHASKHSHHQIDPNRRRPQTTLKIMLFRSSDLDEEFLISEQPPSLLTATPINSLWLAILTYWTSLRVAVAHLITFETIVVSAVSAGSVVFFSLVEPQSSEPLVANISLTFISFIIVFPITANIGYAFVRREQALQAVASIKSYVISIYFAHRDWAFDPAKGKKCTYSARNILNVTLTTTTTTDKHDEPTGETTSNDEWDTHGGAASEQHVDEVRHVMIKMVRAMRDYLALPLASRSRHFYTWSGRRTREIVCPVQHSCLQDFYEQIQRLSLAVERMKEAGLPGNEAARINQYHSLLLKEWEVVRCIKNYRTPTGLRAFARLYILVHPVFVGPYYAWVAGAGRDSSDNWPFQTSLSFAIALAIFTAVAMQGLFNVEVGLEDPFDESEGLDNVRVGIIFREIERLICMDWAPQVWNDVVVRGKPLYDAKFNQDFGRAPKDIPRPGLLEAKLALKKDMHPFSCSSCWRG
jgi:hypothetical protein